MHIEAGSIQTYTLKLFSAYYVHNRSVYTTGFLPKPTVVPLIERASRS